MIIYVAFAVGEHLFPFEVPDKKPASLVKFLGFPKSVILFKSGRIWDGFLYHRGFKGWRHHYKRISRSQAVQKYKRLRELRPDPVIKGMPFKPLVLEPDFMKMINEIADGFLDKPQSGRAIVTLSEYGVYHE